jgi:hypothetical protein
MRLRTWPILMVALLLSTAPAYACERPHRHEPKMAKLDWVDVLFGGLAAGRSPAARSPSEKVDLSAYAGLGSWIDIFNTKPWSEPAEAVRTMDERGAETIFLQTSTYGESKGMFDERAIDQLLHHAHRRGMEVVAWYVPSFTQQKIDLRRVVKAIRYQSPSGERFDSFGLDIEATHVDDIERRNDRLLALSRRIRNAAGESYPLSAITPDPVASLYWPSFPWKDVARIYDVIVPMGYFTFRADGYEEVREYTTDNIRKIRRETGRRNVPIHFIGGIANDAGPIELRGFVRATREHEVMGASLYDYPITSRRSWYELRALKRSVVQRRRAETKGQGRASKGPGRRSRSNGAARMDEGDAGKGGRRKDGVRGPRKTAWSASRRGSDRSRQGGRAHRRPRAPGP